MSRTSYVDAGPRPPHQLIARFAATRLAAASDEMLRGLQTSFAPEEISA